MVGEPIEAFFGWEVVGVYQNDEEIQNDPIAVANGLVPGDFKYRDRNGDGEINADDRTVIGSYLPSFVYGGNLQVSYKQFDLSVAIAGQTGNDILNRRRGEVLFTNDTNMDADFAINRWHGEGTSNSYPSSEGRRKAWNQRMSTFFVEDGSGHTVVTYAEENIVWRERLILSRSPLRAIHARKVTTMGLTCSNKKDAIC